MLVLSRVGISGHVILSDYKERKISLEPLLANRFCEMSTQPNPFGIQNDTRTQPLTQIIERRFWTVFICYCRMQTVAFYLGANPDPKGFRNL
jgi:hypothetical protein